MANKKALFSIYIHTFSHKSTYHQIVIEENIKYNNNKYNIYFHHNSVVSKLTYHQIQNKHDEIKLQKINNSNNSLRKRIVITTRIVITHANVNNQ